MATKDFLKHLNRKLKTGNLKSIHLNALPGRYATRLDLCKLDVLKEDLSTGFLETLLLNPSFRFKISLDSQHVDQLEEEQSRELTITTKKLDAICYQNNDTFLEHGIKTFGFGYPILIWKDKKDPTRLVRAPLLIWNLDIEKSASRANEWTLVREEDFSVMMNELLLSYIEEELKITFSGQDNGFPENGLMGMEDINRVCSLILDRLGIKSEEENQDIRISPCPANGGTDKGSNKNPWISWSGIFGLYRTQKASIIRDFEQLIKDHGTFDVESTQDDTWQTSSLTCVDTDPDQEEILNSMTHSNTRIIQGPPGTGKSQSLTAIITNALANGAKCLVVCEKKTALDVIRQNLDAFGLAGLCAVVDDVNKDRKRIIEQVRAALEEKRENLPIFREQEYIALMNEYTALQEEINHKHKAVLARVFGDDRWKDLVGRYLSREKMVTNDWHKGSLNDENYSFNFMEYNGLVKTVKEGKHLFPGAGTLSNPLNLLFRDLFKGSYLNTLQKEIEDNLNKLLQRCISNQKELTNFKLEYGANCLKNRWIDKLSLSLAATVSSRKKLIRYRRKEILTNFQLLQSFHNQISYFSFLFEDAKEVVDLSQIGKSLARYESTIQSILNEFDMFREFYMWKSFILSLKKSERDLIHALIRTGMDDWTAALESWYFDGVLRKNEESSGPFHQNERLFTLFSSVRESLKRMQVNKILNQWVERRSDSVARFKSNKGIINSLYNFRKNNLYGRKNSLRKIIHTDFDLFTEFFPVVMVNPVVASSILPLQEGIFDVVIFDEASQLRLEDTYPSFLRGKHRMISGDVHQMPPSNYFAREIVLDIDDQEADDQDGTEVFADTTNMADKESLLQFAVDSGFEKSHLNFHYRSRHPDLIGFSNAAFYGSRLTPMPEKSSYKAIRFIAVNGRYEKSRTNPEEASAVVDILFSEIMPDENGCYPSVGVATFNIDQRNLILEMIQDKCYQDKEACKVLEKLTDSGLFVKNLENIQGDERDIMILSTTFGLNAEGKFRQHFGPLNQPKGYRLLNVIITRARDQVYVCTSIPATYINQYQEEISTKGNVGKGILYAYLAYAKSVADGNVKTRDQVLKLVGEHCPDSEHQPAALKHISSFEQEVFDSLTMHLGKERVIMNYPFGGFRIGFVILSTDGSQPILAIECDGASYHASEEAYMHDLYRRKLIEEEMGVPYYRTWSTNWWVDPDKEVNRIVEEVEELDRKYT